MRLSKEEHAIRKAATALDFTVKKLDGKVVNPSVVSKTVQGKQFRDAADVNLIVKRGLKRDGSFDMSALPPGSRQPGMYGDFTKATDYQSALNAVIKMRQDFNKLKPEVRFKFDNDPAKLVAFLDDPKNEEEAIKLGILPKPKIETRIDENPEGRFWIMTRNGKEIKREKLEKKSGAATPSA